MSMSLPQKLTILADAAKYDASCASSGSKRAGDAKRLGDTNKIGICHSYTPDGRCVSLLKILLTNHCIYDCKFCVNRVSSDTPRARFTPAEVAHLTIEFYKRNYIEGLFLSSGIIRSPDYTMEQMCETVRLLRDVHGFNGYVHLKAVPGASAELFLRAGRLADRLSANIELPTPADLSHLAPEKKLPEIESAMTVMGDAIAEAKSDRTRGAVAPVFAPAGQSTQMIVGATESSDAAILSAASHLYHRHRLRRVYYSAFSPIPFGDWRLPTKAPPLVREHRLYQADWLMRFYEFDVTEITAANEPNLPLDVDPKAAWAMRHPEFFPVDINRAERFRLLRVPGLGVRNVNRILRTRKYHSIRLDDLSRLRISLAKIRPWITTADHNPDCMRLDRVAKSPKPTQLELFSAATAAQTGEL